MTHSLFIEPLDILYLRGNKLFGDAGAHGEALMPPWPSLAAGAIRSRLMAEGQTLDDLAGFRLDRFGLARRDGAGQPEALWPLPADVRVGDEALAQATYLRPVALPAGIASSHALPRLPALCAEKPVKAVAGLWLNAQGIEAWLAGKEMMCSHLVRSSELWQTDSRLGIALDANKRSAAEGKIYTTECVALAKDVGFVAAYERAGPLPEGCLVRLGGDGRGGRATAISLAPAEPDWARIEREGRFRLLLATPGIFAEGWCPSGVPATLVAATVNRAETISGWDLLTGKPKAARRIAPAGSVYWYEHIADLDALRALARDGLPLPDAARCAEGFNHCHIAPWA